MRGCYYLYCAHPSTTCIFIIIRVSTLYMMTVHFYNYLAAVEVQPQSVATPTHKFTRARYSFDRCCTTSGTNVNRPGQILQIRDCPGDSGTVGAYGNYLAHRACASFVRIADWTYCACDERNLVRFCVQRHTNSW